MAMNKNGTIKHMEPEAIANLRNHGVAHKDPRSSVVLYRDIRGMDDRVWQHLLDCADAVRKLGVIV